MRNLSARHAGRRRTVPEVPGDIHGCRCAGRCRELDWIAVERSGAGTGRNISVEGAACPVVVDDDRVCRRQLINVAETESTDHQVGVIVLLDDNAVVEIMKVRSVVALIDIIDVVALKVILKVDLDRRATLELENSHSPSPV